MSHLTTTNRPKFRRDRQAIRRAQIVQAIPAYTINSDPLLTEEEAAGYLSLARTTLTVWRCKYPDRLPYIKMGKKAVRYRKSALDQFIKQQTVTDGAGVKHG
jgi:predicted DNA-binding transcriptional regulator AlpA